MSKGNLFLGQARGAVGDVVFSHYKGRQVARARNRAPRNPQTPLQLLQRVVQSTVGKAYSFFSPICDHSWERYTASQASQEQFMKENVALLRDKLADEIAYPTEENMLDSEAISFSFAGDSNPVFNEYQISKGSLPVMVQRKVSDASGIYPARWSGQVLTNLETAPAQPLTVTYQQLCDALGVQPGDQLTSLEVIVDVSAFSQQLLVLNFARVILMPNDGDMTSPFLSAAGVVNKPNVRNYGTFSSTAFSFTAFENAGVYFGLQLPEPDTPLIRAGGCIILSRQGADGIWLRSSQKLLSYADMTGWSGIQDFPMAYESYKKASPASGLYLNQAQGF